MIVIVVKMIFLIVILTVSFSVNSEPIQSKKGSERIVGGAPAAAGEFHGVISIQKAESYPSFESHYCGGTLINERHVLTTAVCVMDNAANVVYKPSYFMLVGDDLRIDDISGTRQAKTASHIFVHPKFSTKNQSYSDDIAVIRTSSPFMATTTFSPVTIIQDSPNTNTICDIAGWGSTSSGSPYSHILMRIRAPVIDRKTCNEYFQGKLEDGMFCAGTVTGTHDVCDGDIGGGLICGNSIAGIASWGFTSETEECDTPHKPGIYTDVADYKQWLEEVITIQQDLDPTTNKCRRSFSNDSTESVLTNYLSFTCIMVLLLSHRHY